MRVSRDLRTPSNRPPETVPRRARETPRRACRGRARWSTRSPARILRKADAETLSVSLSLYLHALFLSLSLWRRCWRVRASFMMRVVPPVFGLEFQNSESESSPRCSDERLPRLIVRAPIRLVSRVGRRRSTVLQNAPRLVRVRAFCVGPNHRSCASNTRPKTHSFTQGGLSRGRNVSPIQT